MTNEVVYKVEMFGVVYYRVRRKDGWTQWVVERILPGPGQPKVKR